MSDFYRRFRNVAERVINGHAARGSAMVIFYKTPLLESIGGEDLGHESRAAELLRPLIRQVAEGVKRGMFLSR